MDGEQWGERRSTTEDEMVAGSQARSSKCGRKLVEASNGRCKQEAATATVGEWSAEQGMFFGSKVR